MAGSARFAVDVQRLAMERPMVGMLLAVVLGAISFGMLVSAFLTFFMSGPVSGMIGAWLGGADPSSAGDLWWFYFIAHMVAAIIQFVAAAVLLLASRLALLLGI